MAFKIDTETHKTHTFDLSYYGWGVLDVDIDNGNVEIHSRSVSKLFEGTVPGAIKFLRLHADAINTLISKLEGVK